MAGKAGARRFSVALMDIDALQSIIDKAVDAKGLGAFKLGDYAKMLISIWNMWRLLQNLRW